MSEIARHYMVVGDRYDESLVSSTSVVSCASVSKSLLEPAALLGYVIVIARLKGFMAVNLPSPRAQPKDKVGLRCHKSLTTTL